MSRRIQSTPEAVWRVLVDLVAWPQWGLTVQRAELSSGTELRLGAVGKVWTPVGVPLPFEITEFDDGRAWEWNVAGVPATRHEVLPDGEGAVLNFAVPWWAPAYLPVMAVALPRIEQLARAGAASLDFASNWCGARFAGEFRCWGCRLV